MALLQDYLWFSVITVDNCVCSLFETLITSLITVLPVNHVYKWM
jgi:hypothetical protein